jgi:dethiobiotin synthetase
MRSQGLLITGTDTGVGKTFVGCGVAAALRRRGLSVAPFKPAETGCAVDETSNILVPADAVALRDACQSQAPLDVICPYRFRQPLAPAVAAEPEGRALQLDAVMSRLEECFATLSSSHDIVLVETAGGILVPIAYGFHYGDLACLLNVPVLVVVGSKLGAINHTLLTLICLESLGLKIFGCVINHPNADTTPAVEHNEHALRKLAAVPLWVLPHSADTSADAVGAMFDDIALHLLAGFEWRR